MSLWAERTGTQDAETRTSRGYERASWIVWTVLFLPGVAAALCVLFAVAPMMALAVRPPLERRECIVVVGIVKAEDTWPSKEDGASTAACTAQLCCLPCLAGGVTALPQMYTICAFSNTFIEYIYFENASIKK